MQPAAQERHGGGTAGIQVSKRSFEIGHVIQHPVAFQADGQRLIVSFCA
jgi:hypothetical protein